MTVGAVPFADALLVEPTGPNAANRWAHPAARARRICGIYAAIYQMDPLLFSWCGLAAYVGRRVYEVLDTGVPFGRDLLEEGNLAVYRSMIPNFVAYCWGERSPTTELLAAFTELRVADQVAGNDAASAQTIAASSVLLASTYEQRHVVQPLFERLGPAERGILARNLGFRLGRDSSAPFLSCPGDGTRADARCAWMAETVLPRWQGYKERMAPTVKADMEFFRREGRLSTEVLPTISRRSPRA